jgi:hypothetical protein
LLRCRQRSRPPGRRRLLQRAAGDSCAPPLMETISQTLLLGHAWRMHASHGSTSSSTTSYPICLHSNKSFLVSVLCDCVYCFLVVSLLCSSSANLVTSRSVN